MGKTFPTLPQEITQLMGFGYLQIIMPGGDDPTSMLSVGVRVDYQSPTTPICPWSTFNIGVSEVPVHRQLGLAQIHQSAFQFICLTQILKILTSVIIKYKIHPSVYIINGQPHLPGTQIGISLMKN